MKTDDIVTLKRHTASGIPMQMRRASLLPALELAAEAFDKLAKETPALQRQFKDQANEVRAWLIAEEFADFIILRD